MASITYPKAARSQRQTRETSSTREQPQLKGVDRERLRAVLQRRKGGPAARRRLAWSRILLVPTIGGLAVLAAIAGSIVAEQQGRMVGGAPAPQDKPTSRGAQVKTFVPAPSSPRASLLAKAQGGNADAMLGLAQMLMEGRDGAKDEGGGLFWLRKAADAGNGRAMQQLAEVYDRGSSALRNYNAAADYLLQSWTRPGGDAFLALFERQISQGGVWQPQTLRAIQVRLQRSGHFSGPVNGVVRANTLKAARDYAHR